jgi:1-deoxy-D-xylulose-5-phosphate reductoisomerase
VPQKLEVVIHPQSVIHSMVQYKDNSVVAQLGTPDMRVPIAYGLSWPERMESGAEALNFKAMSDMTFESFEVNSHSNRFPGLQLAWLALEAPPGTTAVLNAANEIAVDAFLNRLIRFDQIHEVNLQTLEECVPQRPEKLEDLLEIDQRSRMTAKRIAQAIAK